MVFCKKPYGESFSKTDASNKENTYTMSVLDTNFLPIQHPLFRHQPIAICRPITLRRIANVYDRSWCFCFIWWCATRSHNHANSIERTHSGRKKLYVGLVVCGTILFHYKNIFIYVFILFIKAKKSLRPFYLISYFSSFYFIIVSSFIRKMLPNFWRNSIKEYIVSAFCRLI